MRSTTRVALFFASVVVVAIGVVVALALTSGDGGEQSGGSPATTKAADPSPTALLTSPQPSAGTEATEDDADEDTSASGRRVSRDGARGQGEEEGSTTDRSGERGSPDPLGMRAAGAPIDLEGSGMKLVAGRFVSYAYGYSGSDPDQYYRKLYYPVEMNIYEDSPGGRLLKRNRDHLAAGDKMSGAATLGDITYIREVQSSELKEYVPAEGIAPAYEVEIRYRVGERWTYPEGGGEPLLGGQIKTYTQRVVMLESLGPNGEPVQGGWKVIRGSAPKEISSEKGE